MGGTIEKCQAAKSASDESESPCRDEDESPCGDEDNTQST